jgi:hypothetical protein
MPMPSTSPAPALVISIAGVPSYPGCVVPSIITVSTMASSPTVSAIVCGGGPGMSKWITSGPGVVFVRNSASRSEPGPESFVFVTPRSGAAL